MPEAQGKRESRISAPGRGLQFFGRLSASVSHELNNIMTIIMEKSGLLEDLAFSMEKGRDLDPQRLRDVGESFTRQARRAVDILKRFNRFAHTVDDPRGTFELKALVENLALLTGRFAALKKLELKTELDEAGLNVNGSAFTVQHLVFTCLDACLQAMEPGGVITMAARGSGHDVVVHISAAPAPEQGLPETMLQSVRLLARDTGCGRPGAHSDHPKGCVMNRPPGTRAAPGRAEQKG